MGDNPDLVNPAPPEGQSSDVEEVVSPRTSSDKVEMLMYESNRLDKLIMKCGCQSVYVGKVNQR